MESHVRSFLFGSQPTQTTDNNNNNNFNLSSRLSYLRFLTSTPFSSSLTAPAAPLPVPRQKQKRPLDTSNFPFPPSHTKKKRMKIDHHVLVNSLPTPVQEALVRFRETSELELERLKKEGYDTPSSISKLTYFVGGFYLKILKGLLFIPEFTDFCFGDEMTDASF